VKRLIQEKEGGYLGVGILNVVCRQQLGGLKEEDDLLGVSSRRREEVMRRVVL